MRLLAITLTALALAGCASQLSAARLPDGDDPALRQHLAASSLVVVGRLSVPADFSASFGEGRGYANFPVTVTAVLKGRAYGPSIPFTVYTTDGTLSARREQLGALSDATIVVLSQGGDDGRSYITSYPHPGGERLAVWRCPDGACATIAEEVRRQAAIAENWVNDPTLPHYDEAKRLIEAIIATPGDAGENEATAYQGHFDALVALGRPAVPALVSLMDDRRALPIKAVTFGNGAGAFEAYRHYGPECVVDAVAGVLNQITGRSYGFIYNGATEEQRRAEIAGWRVYVMDTPDLAAQFSR